MSYFCGSGQKRISNDHNQEHLINCNNKSKTFFPAPLSTFQQKMLNMYHPGCRKIAAIQGSMQETEPFNITYFFPITLYMEEFLNPIFSGP
jgi:hypothetical protein